MMTIAASMGFFILVGGEFSKLKAFPHTFLPVELISIIILAALIGAIVVAR